MVMPHEADDQPPADVDDDEDWSPPRIHVCSGSSTSGGGQILMKCDEPSVISVDVVGHPEPSVRWHVGNRRVQKSPKYRVTSTGSRHTLTVLRVTDELERGVWVMATNAVGEDSCLIQIKTYKVLTGLRNSFHESVRSVRESSTLLRRSTTSFRSQTPSNMNPMMSSQPNLMASPPPPQLVEQVSPESHQLALSSDAWVQEMAVRNRMRSVDDLRYYSQWKRESMYQPTSLAGSRAFSSSQRSIVMGAAASTDLMDHMGVGGSCATSLLNTSFCPSVAATDNGSSTGRSRRRRRVVQHRSHSIGGSVASAPASRPPPVPFYKSVSATPESINVPRGVAEPGDLVEGNFRSVSSARSDGQRIQKKSDVDDRPNLPRPAPNSHSQMADTADSRTFERTVRGVRSRSSSVRGSGRLRMKPNTVDAAQPVMIMAATNSSSQLADTVDSGTLEGTAGTLSRTSSMRGSRRRIKKSNTEVSAPQDLPKPADNSQLQLADTVDSGMLEGTAGTLSRTSSIRGSRRRIKKSHTEESAQQDLPPVSNVDPQMEQVFIGGTPEGATGTFSRTSSIRGSRRRKIKTNTEESAPQELPMAASSSQSNLADTADSGKFEGNAGTFSRTSSLRGSRRRKIKSNTEVSSSQELPLVASNSQSKLADTVDDGTVEGTSGTLSRTSSMRGSRRLKKKAEVDNSMKANTTLLDANCQSQLTDTADSETTEENSGTFKRRSPLRNSMRMRKKNLMPTGVQESGLASLPPPARKAPARDVVQVTSTSQVGVNGGHPSSMSQNVSTTDQVVFNAENLSGADDEKDALWDLFGVPLNVLCQQILNEDHCCCFSTSHTLANDDFSQTPDTVFQPDVFTVPSSTAESPHEIPSDPPPMQPVTSPPLETDFDVMETNHGDIVETVCPNLIWLEEQQQWHSKQIKSELQSENETPHHRFVSTIEVRLTTATSTTTTLPVIACNKEGPTVKGNVELEVAEMLDSDDSKRCVAEEIAVVEKLVIPVLTEADKLFGTMVEHRTGKEDGVSREEEELDHEAANVAASDNDPAVAHNDVGERNDKSTAVMAEVSSPLKCADGFDSDISPPPPPINLETLPCFPVQHEGDTDNDDVAATDITSIRTSGNSDDICTPSYIDVCYKEPSEPSNMPAEPDKSKTVMQTSLDGKTDKCSDTDKCDGFPVVECEEAVRSTQAQMDQSTVQPVQAIVHEYGEIINLSFTEPGEVQSPLASQQLKRSASGLDVHAILAQTADLQKILDTIYALTDGKMHQSQTASTTAVHQPTSSSSSTHEEVWRAGMRFQTATSPPTLADKDRRPSPLGHEEQQRTGKEHQASAVLKSKMGKNNSNITDRSEKSRNKAESCGQTDVSCRDHSDDSLDFDAESFDCDFGADAADLVDSIHLATTEDDDLDSESDHDEYDLVSVQTSYA